MKLKDLFFANGEWTCHTELKVLGLEREGVLYKGAYIDMPAEIKDSWVVTFMGNTIIIK